MSLGRLSAGLITAVLCLIAAFPASGAQRKKPAAKPTPAKQEAQPAPTPEVQQQLTLAQMPATPPNVEYQNGDLKIVARNSTLADVLREVRNKTGATIDVPANATDRVVTNLGPGPARDVLVRLLNGTNFNYVMVGTAADPTAVEQIVLTQKMGGPDAGSPSVAVAGPAAGQVPYPGAQPQQPGTFGQQVSPSEMPSADDDNDDGQTMTGEGTPPGENQVPDMAEHSGEQQQPPVKTPEQLLQELQRQQEQTQQPSQSAPQGFPAPPDQQIQGNQGNPE